MSSDTDEHISMELVDMDLSMADIYGLSKKKEFYQTFSLTLQPPIAKFPLELALLQPIRLTILSFLNCWVC